MPVQINELVIRANVVETGGKEKQNETKPSDSGGVNKSEIVKECVDLVLEMLNNKNKR